VAIVIILVPVLSLRIINGSRSYDTCEVGSNSCSSGSGDIIRNDMKEKVNDDYEDILNDLLKKYQKVLTKA